MADLGSTRVFGRISVSHEAFFKDDVSVDGALSADAFVGNGGGLTNISAGNLNGTVGYGNLPFSSTNVSNWNTAYSQRGSQIAGTGLSWSSGNLNVQNPFNPSGTYSGLRAQATTAADVGAPPTSRTITAGTGLTGGGNLSTNRTLSVDSTVVRTSGNQSIGGNKVFTGTSRFGSNTIGSADGDAFIQTAFTGTAGEDNVHLHLQGVNANDNSGGNFNGGAFIHFATSTSSDYGAKIGGRRRSSGDSHFVVKTGGTNTPDSMVIDENGNIIASRGNFQGSGSGLTSLNASNLSSGTISTARLPSAALIGNTTYSAGTGLSLSGTTFSVTNPFNPSGTYSGLRAQATTAADVGAPPTSRTITAGTGLTGGGNLTANRTISVDGTVVRTSGNQSISGNKEFSTGFFGGIATSYGNLSSLVSGGTSAGDMVTGLRIVNTDTSAGTKARVLFTLSTNNSWENVSLEADRFSGSNMRFNIGIGNGSNPPTNIAQFYADRAEINGNLILGEQGTTTAQAVRADRTITAGTGLSGGGNLTANRTLSVQYGTTAGTAAQGNDSRLSNSREWTASTVSQAEAEAGTATTARKWTAQRVRQNVASYTDAFSSSGTYSGLRAQATTKADVGLSNVPNWSGSTSTSLGTSNTVIPSQGAVKSYVDSGLSGKANTSGTYSIRATGTTKSDVGLSGIPNTNGSTSNFLRGDGTWATPPNTNTVTRVRANNTGTYRTGNINLIGGSNVTVSEGTTGQFTITATNTNTTYSAGTGLSLSGTTFSLSGDSFNASGSYSSLRARGTTKADVGLSNVPNWSGSTSTSLGTSNTVIPSQGAVKSYVDSGLSGKANTTGTYSGLRAQATTASDVGAPPTSRTISAGDGLSGGGNLGSNRTLSVDSTVVRTSGNQTIGGSKTFSSPIEIDSDVGQYRIGGGTGTYRMFNMVSRNGNMTWYVDEDQAAGLEWRVHKGGSGHTNRFFMDFNNGAFTASSFIGSGSGLTGTATNLRARATTKADVGLSNVRNVTGYSQTESNDRYPLSVQSSSSNYPDALDGGLMVWRNGSSSSTDLGTYPVGISCVQKNTNAGWAMAASISGGSMYFQSYRSGWLSPRMLWDDSNLSNPASQNSANTFTSIQTFTNRMRLSYPMLSGVSFANSHIRVLPSSGTNTTGRSSIALGTSPISGYGWTINAHRFGSTGTGRLHLNNHNNSDTGDQLFTYYNTGSFEASGNITAYSDARIKDNIQVIDSAIDKVQHLSGYTYTRTDLEDKETRHTGVIAQEVLEVLPEAVLGGPTEEDPDAKYSVAYGNMVGLLIEAVKEQQQTIDTQSKQISELYELVKEYK